MYNSETLNFNIIQISLPYNYFFQIKKIYYVLNIR